MSFGEFKTISVSRRNNVRSVVEVGLSTNLAKILIRTNSIHILNKNEIYGVGKVSLCLFPSFDKFLKLELLVEAIIVLSSVNCT